MTTSILAFGAAGKFAGLVVPELVKRGLSVRAFVKNDADAQKARARGANDIAFGDLADASSVARALRGIERVFYIAPAFLPNEVDVGKRVVAECVAGGVKRIVFSSVIHPVLSLSNHAAKAPVEEAILDSGLEYSFLHPTLYFQNFAAAWSKAVESGVLAEPWSTETRFSRVDYRDVAEVAAIALHENRLLHGTFELASEGELNRHDVAKLMSEVAGKPIRAEKLDPKHLGDDAAPLRPMFEHYDHHGLVGNSLTLRAILGREPRSLRAYFQELAQS